MHDAASSADALWTTGTAAVPSSGPGGWRRAATFQGGPPEGRVVGWPASVSPRTRVSPPDRGTASEGWGALGQGFAQSESARASAEATVGTTPSSRNAGMKHVISGSTLRTPTLRATTCSAASRRSRARTAW